MTENLTVAALSEAQLIARFAPLLNAGWPETDGDWAEPDGGGAESGGPYQILGPGDDCAVVAAPDRRFVISTDTQVEGQDFELQWPSGFRSSGLDTGHKCATQNLADAAAMGAVPSSLVVSLTLPSTTPVQWVEDFARGLRAGMVACGADRCRVVGGDLGAGREISVTATVTGDLQGRAPVRRNGAQPGDVVVLAGTVGRAAAGLEILRESAYRPGDNAAVDALVQSQLRPVTPVQLGAELARCGATSMIDVSDGLVRDASRVARASGVEMVLDPHALEALARELQPAARLTGRDPLYWVLNGGEDHGLLSTVPPHHQLPDGVRPLGSVRAAAKGWPTASAAPTAAASEPGSAAAQQPVWVANTPVSQLPEGVRGQGWDHFESEDGF
ncbi:thiamine-phosphate kinase [Kocuria sp.]|uniref:thiamine-phosphate kinase n=1 Tax=Kocuria sp. TaxID=1871328 RepID=UPI0026E049AE|nr:thiamine-phosphate kinase [Kocuria sp.]MDO5618324.1 thiamine-phosphate kinase [Kocuria sp.]